MLSSSFLFLLLAWNTLAAGLPPVAKKRQLFGLTPPTNPLAIWTFIFGQGPGECQSLCASFLGTATVSGTATVTSYATSKITTTQTVTVATTNTQNSPITVTQTTTKTSLVYSTIQTTVSVQVSTISTTRKTATSTSVLQALSTSFSVQTVYSCTSTSVVPSATTTTIIVGTVTNAPSALRNKEKRQDLIQIQFGLIAALDPIYLSFQCLLFQAKPTATKTTTRTVLATQTSVVTVQSTASTVVLVTKATTSFATSTRPQTNTVLTTIASTQTVVVTVVSTVVTTVQTVTTLSSVIQSVSVTTIYQACTTTSVTAVTATQLSCSPGSATLAIGSVTSCAKTAVSQTASYDTTCMSNSLMSISTNPAATRSQTIFNPTDTALASIDIEVIVDGYFDDAGAYYVYAFPAPPLTPEVTFSFGQDGACCYGPVNEEDIGVSLGYYGAKQVAFVQDVDILQFLLVPGSAGEDGFCFQLIVTYS